MDAPTMETPNPSEEGRLRCKTLLGKLGGGFVRVQNKRTLPRIYRERLDEMRKVLAHEDLGQGCLSALETGARDESKAGLARWILRETAGNLVFEQWVWRLEQGTRPDESAGFLRMVTGVCHGTDAKAWRRWLTARTGSE